MEHFDAFTFSHLADVNIHDHNIHSNIVLEKKQKNAEKIIKQAILSFSEFTFYNYLL